MDKAMYVGIEEVHYDESDVTRKSGEVMKAAKKNIVIIDYHEKPDIVMMDIDLYLKLINIKAMS